MSTHTDLFMDSSGATIRLRFHRGLTVEQLPSLQDKLTLCKSYNDLLNLARETAKQNGTTFTITTVDNTIQSSPGKRLLLQRRNVA